jgi:hypothetical protein
MLLFLTAIKAKPLAAVPGLCLPDFDERNQAPAALTPVENNGLDEAHGRGGGTVSGRTEEHPLSE